MAILAVAAVGVSLRKLVAPVLAAGNGGLAAGVTRGESSPEKRGVGMREQKTVLLDSEDVRALIAGKTLFINGTPVMYDRKRASRQSNGGGKASRRGTPGLVLKRWLCMTDKKLRSRKHEPGDGGPSAERS